jgi:hypothetical protein
MKFFLLMNFISMDIFYLIHMKKQATRKKIKEGMLEEKFLNHKLDFMKLILCSLILILFIPLLLDSIMFVSRLLKEISLSQVMKSPSRMMIWENQILKAILKKVESNHFCHKFSLVSLKKEK